jgi:S-DNA-T family DNA segregation ATPase FtsK/SpoIIIE
MAKTRKKKSKKSGQLSFKFAVQDDRFPKLMGLLCLFVSFYLLIAFTSYLFTWQEDQDKAYWAILLTPQQMSNWLGRLGAVLSHTFFYWGVGISSFIAVWMVFRTGFSLVMGQNLKTLVAVYQKGLTTMIWTSILFAFIFQAYQFPFGGAFGESIIERLTNLVGPAGVVVLLLFAALAALVWSQNPNFNEWTSDKIIESLRPQNLLKALNKFVNQLVKGSSPFKMSTADAANKEVKEETEIRDDGSVTTATEGTLKSKNTSKVVNTLRPKNKTTEEGEGSTDNFDDLNQLEGPINLSTESVSKEELEERLNKLTKNQLQLDLKEDQEKELKEAEENQEDKLSIEISTQKEPIAPDLRIVEENADHIEPYDPTLELPRFENPVLDLLESYEDKKPVIDRAELEANKDQIIETLLNYKIEIVQIKATIGPTVTLYEIVPAPGVRISKIKNLEDDIALSLAALGIRIIAPIPGKGTIGIEVPNRNKQVVSLREVLASPKFRNAKMDLPIALGKSISNEVFVADLAKMPHLLIAGATGQGKSVGINTIIASLLYKKHPSQLKLILIDPKKVELSPYNKIASHYLGHLPNADEAIVTETSEVVQTLYSITVEMDERYNLLKKAGVRNIREYNARFVQRRLNPEKGHRFLPFIVLIIDEFADLIMTAGKEVELPIGRLAQLARAVGIHLIIATQRPSVNIITGVIKANFPARLAFKVASKIDSRTILDAGGAEQLIGRGDMLLSSGSTLLRLQCAFIDTPEVERVIEHIANQPGYPEPFLLPSYGEDEADEESKMNQVLMDLDEYFEDAARLVVINQSGSTSMLQRRLKLGYNRAGRIMDQLEFTNVVGPNEGSKARKVYFQDEIELELHLQALRDKKSKLTFNR